MAELSAVTSLLFAAFEKEHKLVLIFFTAIARTEYWRHQQFVVTHTRNMVSVAYYKIRSSRTHI